VLVLVLVIVPLHRHHPVLFVRLPSRHFNNSSISNNSNNSN